MSQAICRQRTDICWALSDLSLDIIEQLCHLCSPRLSILVGDELQFTQVMGIAVDMVTCLKGAIGGPVVMDGPTAELRQDAHGVHGFLSSLLMCGVQGQQCGTCTVKPVKFTGYTQTTLIKVGNFGQKKLSFDLG